MRIATWNVNSIKQRVDSAVAWLKERAPDLVCLQETKCVDDAFPREPFEALGYNIAIHGQKTFNGVAILSKLPFDEVTPRLPGDHADDHARFIEAQVSTPSGVVRVAGIYLPNGNPVGTDKFAYKLKWMERLREHASALLAFEEPMVIAGDYNVIPEPADADRPETWMRDALFQPESRGAWRALQYLGLTDAYMAADGAPGGYTFWDYQGMAWQRNHGIRIDHLLLSPQAADRLQGVKIHRDVRSRDKPSD